MMKNQPTSLNNSQFPSGKNDDRFSNSGGTKVSVAPKIAKKTLKKYKETEEALDKIRREMDSQDTRLLKQQNESRQIEEEYQSKKKEVEHKLMELSRRKQAFEDEKKKAKENLNLEEEKVKKTENKKNIERANLEKYNREIENLKREVEEKEKLRQTRAKEKEKLEAEVIELKKYEDFLKVVMKQSPEFFDEAEGPDGFNVQSLIAKHDRIKNNKKKYEELMEQIDTTKEQETEAFQKYKKEQEEIILLATSEIYNLQEKIEGLSKEKSWAQGEINKYESKTNLETSKWSQILMSIQNLYIRAHEVKNIRDMEKKKEKEREQREQHHDENVDDKNDKVEKKKKEPKEQDDITTAGLVVYLEKVEEEIKFLKDIKSRWIHDEKNKKNSGK